MNTLLCGPITGDLKVDLPFFQEYEDKLTAMGIEVINTLRHIDSCWERMGEMPRVPGMTIGDGGLKWLSDIRFVLDALAFCDTVFLMPDWNHAIDSLMIAFAAQALNRRMIYFEGDQLCERGMTLIGMLDSDTGESEKSIFTPNERCSRLLTDKEFNELLKKWENISTPVGDFIVEKVDADEDEDDVKDVDDLHGRTADLLEKARPKAGDDIGRWFSKQFPENPFQSERRRC